MNSFKEMVIRPRSAGLKCIEVFNLHLYIQVDVRGLLKVESKQS